MSCGQHRTLGPAASSARPSAFGVYFLALVLAAVVVARRATVEPLIAHTQGGIGVTAAILLAACSISTRSTLTGRPGQWIYLGSYILVLIVAAAVLLRFRLDRRRTAS